MSLNDPLANVLSHIKNYEQLGKKEILTPHNSKIIKKVLEIMQQNNFIGSFEEVPSGSHSWLKINLLGRINKTGVIKPQFQITKDDFVKYEQRFLPARDFGIIIISTNLGLMTLKEANEKRIGGKLISFVY
ncbi:30S ribosomal protein S8 [Candidatus Woesearchaeota archaeon]|nr:30S ribosomal protein S8 [Candidatus Woesearchaeota archaeon]|tara:strand:- start:2495 stop:2887 length:393 start_codon:yes stop_codon:yes gene_type:complete